MTAVIVSVLVAGALVWIFQLKRNTKVWYEVPFEEGAAYVATQRILGDFETIEEGTVLIYLSTGFSRYDGYIGFFFSDAVGKRRRWDILRVQSYSPSLWRTTLEKDIPNLKAHFEATWEGRDKNETYMGALKKMRQKK